MKRLTTTFVLLSLVLPMVNGARAATDKSASASVAGTWDCIAHHSVQGDVPFTLTLQQDKETLTGKIVTADGELPITSGTFKNSLLEVHCDTDQAKYLVTGKLEVHQLKGHWSKTVEAGAGDDQGGNQGGEWEGKMSASAKSAAR